MGTIFALRMCGRNRQAFLKHGIVFNRTVECSRGVWKQANNRATGMINKYISRIRE